MKINKLATKELEELKEEITKLNDSIRDDRDEIEIRRHKENELCYGRRKEWTNKEAQSKYQRNKDRAKELRKFIQDAEKRSYITRIFYDFTVNRGTVLERTQKLNVFLREWKEELPKVERQILAYETGLKEVNQEIQKAQKTREDAESALLTNRETLKERAEAYRTLSRKKRAMFFDAETERETKKKLVEWEERAFNILNLNNSDEEVIRTQERLNYYAEHQEELEAKVDELQKAQKIEKDLREICDELINSAKAVIIRQGGYDYLSLEEDETREGFMEDLREKYSLGGLDAVRKFKEKMIESIPSILEERIQEAREERVKEKYLKKKKVKSKGGITR